MALTVWTQPSGSLGIFQEGSNFNLQLPVNPDNEVNYSVISGKLPGGLWLYNDYILGSPFEVARDTDFSFCIRATKNNQIADRTFTITISGADAPVILTPTGLLDVGPYQQLFVVDNSVVNYQLTAIDTDTLAGQSLTYFITEGVLPPGLSLTPDGVIYGEVNSVTTLRLEEGNGSYDHGFYGVGPYDFASPQAQNGYDVLKYDYAGLGYDYFTISQPRALNRIYDFVVAVTDGDTLSPPYRKFQLYVINPMYFRADSESLISNSNIFTADVTYNQQPVWITPSNLGTHRANNYLTFVLDVFDTKLIYYKLELVNANSIAIANRKTLQDNRIGSYTVSTTSTTKAPQVGHYIKFNGSNIYNQVTQVLISNSTEYTLTMSSPLDVNIANGTRFFIGTKSELPLGMSFDSITGDVFGRVPAQSAITNTYNFTVTAIRIGDNDTDETNSVSRVFTVDIIGEIDSVIQWSTATDLGRINAGYSSVLSINATTTLSNAIVAYTIVDGKLPPGLKLEYDGEITGTISQYSNHLSFDNYTTVFDSNPLIHYVSFDNNNCVFDSSLTTFGTSILKADTLLTRFYDTTEINVTELRIFDNNLTTFTPAYFTTFDDTIKKVGLLTFDLRLPQYTTFDNNTTTIDRVYKFTVAASDQYQLGISNREFLITVDTPNKLNYSNIYVKPFMTPTHRDIWSKFINNLDIFTSSSIYRPYDTSFGVQDSLSMLIYAGIETQLLSDYSSLTNNSIKRFQFEDVYKATAYLPGTKTPVYEVIYIKMIDPLMYQTSSNKNNVNSWRSQISNLGEIKWDYLPLWMRSVQSDSRMELGFILAVPLCFCKVGSADTVMLNIKNSNFDFKLLDYTVDRFIINKIIGEDSDKYIVFNNRNLQ